ncbi:LCP family protein [Paenibacillus pasadenensis]|uniref:LCP family glycopolymer transferase n=1 Tax=Paenibacillus pasadenensis TaxID=217090 RepID=UPI00203D0BDA|nr:LCP family protein [Paenibacillus pasadenensis]MCM3749145.1 LCP family protein [Paenibacillus pasadenensis]
MSLTQKRILISVLSVLLIVGIAVVGLGIYAYNSIKGTANKVYEPTKRPSYVSKDPDVETVPSDNLPFTMLVMGVDERRNDVGRADTMMLLAVNPEKNDVLMLSIPRDTRTTIVGHGTEDKINHSYAFGGVTMAVQTVESFIDYPVDYYVKVNMEGFAKVVDLLGGVKVDNKFAFTYEGHSFDKGELLLSGEQALLYSRMRYDDPRGDFGRQSRQRDIIQQVMKNALTVSSLTKANGMLEEIGGNVKTDVSFETMKDLLVNYRPKIEKISQKEISGRGTRIGGIYYYIVDQAERGRIHDMIKEHQKQTQGALH